MDMVKDPDIPFDEESASPTLEGELEDNIKAPATEKVTTSKEENKEVYQKKQFRVAWERIKSLTGTKVMKGKNDNKICWKLLFCASLTSDQKFPERDRSEGYPQVS